MSIIDKRRVAAVAMLEALGYTFSLAEGWTSPAVSSQPIAHTITEADAIQRFTVTWRFSHTRLHHIGLTTGHLQPPSIC
jgi:hypothetical protein